MGVRGYTGDNWLRGEEAQNLTSSKPDNYLSVEDRASAASLAALTLIFTWASLVIKTRKCELIELESNPSDLVCVTYVVFLGIILGKHLLKAEQQRKQNEICYLRLSMLPSYVILNGEMVAFLLKNTQPDLQSKIVSRLHSAQLKEAIISLQREGLPVEHLKCVYRSKHGPSATVKERYEAEISRLQRIYSVIAQYGLAGRAYKRFSGYFRTKTECQKILSTYLIRRLSTEYEPDRFTNCCVYAMREKLNEVIDACKRQLSSQGFSTTEVQKIKTILSVYIPINRQNL